MRKIITRIVLIGLIAGLLQPVTASSDAMSRSYLLQNFTPTVQQQILNSDGSNQDADLYPAPAVTGIQYYVDSVNGSDSADGKSESTPFKTLSKSTSVLTFGDALYLKCGSLFFEQLGLNFLSGHPEKPIIIDCYGSGAKPVISGPISNSPVVGILNSEGIHIRNLELVSASGLAGIQIMTLPIGGYRGLSGFKNITITGCYIHDINPSYEAYETGGIIFRNWAENAGDQTPTFFDGVVVQGNIIRNVKRSGIFFTSRFINRGGINFGVNTYVSDTEGWYPSKNITVRSNTITNVAGDGIVVIGALAPLIEKNTVTNMMGWNPIPGTANAAIWTQATNDALIQYNEVADSKLPTTNNDGEAFDIDISCKDTIIQYNYSHNNEGGFILACTVAQTNAVVTSGTIIRNNLSVNDGVGFRGEVFIFAGPVSNTKIYNNTVYVSGNVSKLFGNFPFQDENGVSRWPDGMMFENNIIYNNGTGNNYSIGDSTNYVFTNNLYWGTWGAPAGHQNPIQMNPRMPAPGTLTNGRAAGLSYVPEITTWIPPAGAVVDNNGGLDYFGKNTTGKSYVGAFLWNRWSEPVNVQSYLQSSPGVPVNSIDGSYDGISYRFSQGSSVAGQLIFSAPDISRFVATGIVVGGIDLAFEVSTDGVNYTPITTTITATAPGSYYTGTTYTSAESAHIYFIKVIFPAGSAYGPGLSNIYQSVSADVVYNESIYPTACLSSTAPLVASPNNLNGFFFSGNAGSAVYYTPNVITGYDIASYIGDGGWGGVPSFEVSSDNISYTRVNNHGYPSAIHAVTGWSQLNQYIGAFTQSRDIHYIRVNLPGFSAGLGIPDIYSVSLQTTIPVQPEWNTPIYGNSYSSATVPPNVGDITFDNVQGIRFSDHIGYGSADVVYSVPGINQFKATGIFAISDITAGIRFETSTDGITYTPIKMYTLSETPGINTIWIWVGKTMMSEKRYDINFIKARFTEGGSPWLPELCNIYTAVSAPVEFTSHSISGTTITGIEPGSTIAEFLVGVHKRADTTLSFNNLASGNRVGTGSTMDVVVNSNLTGTYTLVIYGDVDKDAFITVGDLALLRSCLLKNQTLTNSALAAAKINRQASVTVSDLLTLKKHIIGIAGINQT